MMASFDVPPTQNTAPVLDYRCMFTSDLRRKQKRWQDGLLKFHTFNKRVMVYDDRNNFVGDTHWREEQLEEGEELELDRRGILVEVGEFQGQKDQDLTELVDKRRKDREERVAAKVAASPVGSMMRGYGAPRGTEALRPKPLNEMLTPTGHYGRAAIPTVSPFEEKQRLTSKSVDENERPSKRQKRIEDVPSKSGYAQSLMGTTLNLTSSRPPSTASIRYEPLRLKSSLPPKSDVSIDLTADTDNEEDTIRSDHRRNEEKSRKIPASRKRSPPAKSGYASSLTGAALSLSRPASFPSRNNSGSLLGNKVVPRPSAVKPSDIIEKLPSAAEDDSFMNIDSSIGSPIPPPKMGRLEKENITNRQSLQELFDSKSSTPIRGQQESPKMDNSSRPKSSFITQSSSPPSRKGEPREKSNSSKPKNAHSGSSLLIIQSRPNLNEVASSNQRTVKDSSAVEETPKSSLRIKSRPPRNKMMVLMGRSSSGSSSHAAVANASSGQKSNPQSRNHQESAANELVPSQATLELDAFCERQEEKIQALLKGQRSKVGVDEFLSSPLDSGIDHLTIDLILSRKNDPPDREVNSNCHQSNNEPPESASTRKTGTRPLSEKLNSSVFKTNIRDGIPDSERVRGLNLCREDLPSAKAASERFPNIPEQEGRCQSPKNQSSIETGLPQEKLVSSGKPLNFQRGRVSDEPMSIAEPTKATHVMKGDTIKPGLTSPTSNLKLGGNLAFPAYDAAHFAESPIQDVANAIFFKSPVPPRRTNDQRPRDGSKSPGSEESSNRSRVQKAVASRDAPGNEVRVNIPKITSPKEKMKDGSAQQANAPNQHIPMIRPELPVVLPNGNQKMKALPAHMTIAISGAMEYFRPKLQSTPIAQQEIVESPFATSEKGQVIQDISSPYSALPNRQSDPRACAVKVSPKSSPVELPTGETRPQNENITIGKKELAPMPPQAVFRETKARLVNPATRGKSLQSIAANTADLLNPTSNNMAPPPAAVSNISRVNRTNPRDMTERRVEAVPVAGRLDVREESRGGPWSRESFDLFGSWKPPGGAQVRA